MELDSDSRGVGKVSENVSYMYIVNDVAPEVNAIQPVHGKDQTFRKKPNPGLVEEDT